MTYRLSHFALAAMASLGASASMAEVTAIAAMDGELQSSRLVVDMRGVPSGAEGNKLWFAVMHNGQIFFHGDTGFVPFQCPGSCDAPAYQAVGADPQRIILKNLDARSFMGAKVYVGWGRSFAELVNTMQIREVLTVATPSADPMSLAYSGIYSCRMTHVISLKPLEPSGPDWSAKIEVTSTEATVDLSQARTESGLGFQSRWGLVSPKTATPTLLGGGPGTLFPGSVLYSLTTSGTGALTSAYFLPAGGAGATDASGSAARMLLKMVNWDSMSGYEETCDRI